MSETESVCGKSVARKFPTNLKQHLRLAHPSVMKEVSRKEAEAKKEKEEAESLKLAASLKYTHQATLKETLSVILTARTVQGTLISPVNWPFLLVVVT